MSPPSPTVADAPVSSFDRFGLPADLLGVLGRAGISEPLPIQALTLPDALAGRDVCGKAPTGSGKTLAFALPLAIRAERGTPGRPRGLVLAPTRELAAQIAATLAPLARPRRLRVAAFYGGVGFAPQLRALRQGVDVVVACPGRLADLMRGRHVDLADVDMVVIDEADRMADMGFLPEVRRIVDTTSRRRQTLLFSATLDGAVDVLVRHYQRDPARHEVVVAEADVDLMTHRAHGVAQGDRAALCARLVADEGACVVFVRTRHGADRLARHLERSGVSAVAIHGDRSQRQRDKALAEFKAGHVQALVATDVAARGIHVDGVDCVIHFDPPAEAKDYVHRSGRTARAGATGTVVTLVTPEQRKPTDALWRALGITPQFLDMGRPGPTSSAAPAQRAGARPPQRGRRPRPGGHQGRRAGGARRTGRPA